MYMYMQAAASAPRAPLLTGLPMNDQEYFCPPGGNSCYFFISSTQTYAIGKTMCQTRGGYAVAYNSGRHPDRLRTSACSQRMLHNELLQGLNMRSMVLVAATAAAVDGALLC